MSSAKQAEKSLRDAIKTGMMMDIYDAAADASEKGVDMKKIYDHVNVLNRLKKTEGEYDDVLAYLATLL